MELIKNSIKESIETKNKLLEQTELIIKISELLVNTLRKGNKILVCGNGGSAADSQHFAAELIGRYKKDRKSIPAIALTTDTSIITSIGNDYGYNEVFSKQVEGLGIKGDILIGISTSGNSDNIINAINIAKSKGIETISFLGKDGGLMKQISDISIIVPSNNTPRIQESHILLIHILCEIIENELSSI